MAKRKLYVAAALLVGVALLLYLTTPPALVNAWQPCRTCQRTSTLTWRSRNKHRGRWTLRSCLARRNASSGANQVKRTEYAVIYLHGFSATRQETAPLAEQDRCDHWMRTCSRHA